MNQYRSPIAAPDARRSCMLPWVLLAILLVGFGVTAWWGYNQRETVAQYAVSSLVDQQLADLVPEGVDPTDMAIRVSALMKAVNTGQIDPERLKGMGTMFRDYYDDRKLDQFELESLLAFAEAAVAQ